MTKPTSRRGLLASAAALVLAGAAGCVASGREFEDSISDTIDLEGATGLTVATEGGTVDIVGESRDTVAVAAHKRAASEDDLEAIGLEIDRNGDTIALAVDDETADGPLSFDPGPVLALELDVPDSLRVERVQTGSGDIDVAGVRGPLEVTAGSGAIAIDGVDGAITTETGSGAQTLSALEGSFTAEAGAGSITADVRSLEGDSSIETGSGAVSLTLPSAVDATLDVSTGSGDVTVEGSAVDHVETDGDDDVDLTLGDGTHALEIETESGVVEVAVGTD